MMDNLLKAIRRRKRGEWVKLLRDYLTNFRIWIQENGEKAALVSLVVGVILVVAFKLIFTLAIVGVLLGIGVWFIAEADVAPAPADQSGSSDRPEIH